MGDKTQAFVGKAREYASQNPDLVPNYLDVGAFGGLASGGFIVPPPAPTGAPGG